MRPPVDASRIRELARRLGRIAKRRVRIYLTGGATAVLEGWRQSTIDVDLRFEPEADELLREPASGLRRGSMCGARCTLPAYAGAPGIGPPA